MARSSRKPARGVTFDTLRRLALALPGVEESTSYGTPAFKAKGKLLARLREDGETLVVRIELDARAGLMRSDPETFFITDHYAAYPAVLVRLAAVSEETLGALLEEAWRTFAPKSLVQAAPRPAAKRAAKTAPGKAPKKSASRTASPAAALTRVRALCLALAGVEEKESHGRPSFAVRGKAFVYFMHDHHGDGRLALWCKAPPGAQQMLVDGDPERFFVPPYVGVQGWVGARLEAPDWGAVAACIEEAHTMAAPRPRAARR